MLKLNDPEIQELLKISKQEGGTEMLMILLYRKFSLMLLMIMRTASPLSNVY
jgi:hypothetical protein